MQQLILTVSTHAKEANVQIEPRMTSINAYHTELFISSAGVASISGYVRGKSGVTNAYVEVTLQKKVSGEWIDVESWEDSGTRNSSISETYSVSRGTYRVVMICSADGETKSATSAERSVNAAKETRYIKGDRVPLRKEGWDGGAVNYYPDIYGSDTEYNYMQRVRTGTYGYVDHHYASVYEQ